MAAMRNDKLVEVCDNCLCACCWYGEFMCDDARSAGTVIKTVGELKKLNREHSEYWTDAKFSESLRRCAPRLWCNKSQANNARGELRDERRR